MSYLMNGSSRSSHRGAWGYTEPPRAAGVGSVHNELGDGTHACLDIENRPPTPDKVKKYRKSFYSDPGQRIVHPGLINDMAQQNKLQKYGRTTMNSDHVEDIFNSLPSSEMAEYKQEQREKIYDSKKKEPLGISYSRQHVLPEETKHPEFAFGIPSGASDDAKGLLYPRQEKDESKYKGMYIKSHGSYGPAQQRDRNYAWGNTQVKDPSRHCFGKGAKKTETNGVGMCLNNSTDPSVPQTRIAHKNVERFKGTKDQLGRARNLGHGAVRGLRNDHIYGMGGYVDAWGSKQCIEGEYSVSEQMPDHDLGRATQIGWRNSSVETRSFGVPTVRTDIRAPGPRGRTIADNNNYGDDSSAAALINPCQYSNMGLDDEAFAEALSPETIRDIFSGSGYDLQDEEFERIWHQAAQQGLSRPGDVSVNEFRDCLNDYLDAKEDGKLNSWLARTSIQ